MISSIVLICTVLGGIAAWIVINEVYFTKTKQKESPLLIFYPPIREADKNSFLLDRDKNQELHLGWNVGEDASKKAKYNCFRFEFSVLNTTEIMQTGKLHLAFTKNKNHIVSDAFNINNNDLFCGGPFINKFIAIDDPYERTSIIRSVNETTDVLVINYNYKNISPNKHMKLHFYLNYIPNTILEVKNKNIGVITDPIVLDAEITAGSKVYDVGRLTIYTHVNTGIASMVSTLQAFTLHFLHNTLGKNNFLDRVWLYISSVFQDKSIVAHRLILIPKQYLQIESEGEEYLLATTEHKLDTHAPWQIENLTYKYEYDSLISNPTEMPVKEFLSVKKNLQDKIYSEESSSNNVIIRSLILND